jgi:hypothetical protein
MQQYMVAKGNEYSDARTNKGEFLERLELAVSEMENNPIWGEIRDAIKYYTGKGEAANHTYHLKADSIADAVVGIPVEKRTSQELYDAAAPALSAPRRQLRGDLGPADMEHCSSSIFKNFKKTYLQSCEVEAQEDERESLQAREMRSGH